MDLDGNTSYKDECIENLFFYCKAHHKNEEADLKLFDFENILIFFTKKGSYSGFVIFPQKQKYSGVFSV